MTRLFALDRNFPQPIVDVLADFQADAKLVSLDAIDPRLSTLDDWELLLALHHHEEPWDGLITTDSSMLAQGPELAALIQTKLTLVVTMESGPDLRAGRPHRARRARQRDRRQIRGQDQSAEKKTQIGGELRPRAPLSVSRAASLWTASWPPAS